MHSSTLRPMIADVATFMLLGAVFLGGILQGLSGFAFAAVAGAILLQFEPPGSTILLLMLCSVIIQAVVLVKLRRSISWWASLPAIAGGAVGVLVAIALFNVISAHVFRVGFGCFLIIYATWILLRLGEVLVAGDAGPLGHTAVGFAGGLVGSFTAMPGAVLAMWCDTQAIPRTAQRSLVQPFIAATQTLAVTLLLLRAEADTQQALLRELLIALPALLLGSLIGLLLLGKVNDSAFRKVVCGLLLVAGVAMVR
jgi:uncharacterized membrane protein YfcA